MSGQPESFESSRLDNITFDPLKDAQIGEVLDLYRKSIQPLWDQHDRDYDLKRVEENIRAKLHQKNYWMYVASRDSRVIGYWAWETHDDHTSSHVVAHLRMILVHPELQGDGLGKTIMERFERSASAQGCTKVLFDVIVGSPAFDFYRSLGYRHWSNYMEKHLAIPGES